MFVDGAVIVAALGPGLRDENKEYLKWMWQRDIDGRFATALLSFGCLCAVAPYI